MNVEDHISMNRRAKPLVSYRLIVDLIGATTTGTGLTVGCKRGTGRSSKGLVVTDRETAEIDLNPADFHREWNYTMKPNKRQTNRAVDS